MDNKTITDEIYRLMGQIADRTERMSTYKGKIPAIELDLVMEDTRKMYDYFRLILARSESGYALHQESNHTTSSEASNPVEVEMESDQGDELAHTDSESLAMPEERSLEIDAGAVSGLSGGNDVDVPELAKGEDPIVHEKETPAASEERSKDEKDIGKEPPVSDLAEVSDVKVTSEVKDVVSVPTSDDHDHHVTILAEKLGRRSDKKSINDLIAAKRADVSISSRLQHNPIRDLKSAIGINEKFIYVYELFGGNSQAYAQAIERLNSMGRRDEAIGLMESMREQYHWDIENMAFQKLVDMVARRYSS
jgi:hypothetical protein